MQGLRRFVSLKSVAAEQLQWISEAIDQLEIEKQLPLGHTPSKLPLVESVARFAEAG